MLSLKIPIFQRLLSQVRFSISLQNVRTPFGEPFNKDNHWVKTIAEYKAGMTDFRQSSLYAFHQGFQPNTILDIFEDRTHYSDNSLELGSYPWGRWTSRSGQHEWKNSCHCGPSTDELIKKEWDEFISLFEKIQAEGFNYKRYGHPLGLLFITDSNKLFFIILGGNHRAAIASALGLSKLRVRLLPRSYIKSQIVRLKDISKDSLSKLVFHKVISEDFVNWDGKNHE